MSDALLYLDQLSATEALEILARVAQTHALPHDVGFVFPPAGLRRLVCLVVPDPGQIKTNPKRARCFEAMIEAYRTLRGQEPMAQAPQGRQTELAAGIADLALDQALTPGEASDPAGDNLVLVDHADGEQAKALLLELSTHATAVRIAAAGDRLLFHVKDDHGRKSGFQALMSSGLAGARVLTGYEVGKHRLFLPRDGAPVRRNLEHFLSLVRLHPQLFHLAETAENQELRLALDRVEEKGAHRVELSDLSRLTFHHDIAFTAKADQPIEFRAVTLESDTAALEQLWSQLQQTHRGYRLSLRRTRLRETGERERLRLEEQLAEIRYKLAWLDSAQKPRPVLLRFGPQQLPALADLLRVMPMDTINDENLLYGFQATDHQPGGNHYLMFDPSKMILRDLDPLILWEEAGAPHMRFHLDPFWAKYYHHQDTQSLVCVPHGTALTPTMHDWDQTGMDTWLRKVMTHWFRESEALAKIPARPIYLFDGQPEKDNAIQITVLDQDGFQPLITRLGWLTDNLTLLQALDTERFISGLANEASRRELASAIEMGARESAVRLETMASEVSRDMAGVLEVMTHTLGRELNKVADETQTMVERIRHIRKELREWEQAEAEMKAFAREIRRRKVEVTRKSDENRTRFGEMEERVRRQLASSRSKRMQLLEDINNEVRALRETREYIRDRMFDLKIWE